MIITPCIAPSLILVWSCLISVQRREPYLCDFIKKILIAIFKMCQRRRAKLPGIRPHPPQSHARLVRWKLLFWVEWTGSLQVSVTSFGTPWSNSGKYSAESVSSSSRWSSSSSSRVGPWRFHRELVVTSIFVAYPLFQIKFRFDANANRLVGVHSLS